MRALGKVAPPAATAAAVGVVALISLAGLRAGVLLGDGSPAGIDGGNWLAFGTLSRAGLAYPPLVPTVVAAFTQVVGPAAAIAIVGGSAAAIPGLAILGAAAWVGRPAVGAVAAITASASGLVGETVAWGGYPQTIGAGCAVVALVALAAYLGHGGRRSPIVFAAALALTVATSHLVALPTLLASGMLTVGAVAIGRATGRQAAIVGGLAALVVVPFAPTYQALVGTLLSVPLPPSRPFTDILGPAWPVVLLALVAAPVALIIIIVAHPSIVVSRDLALVAAASAAVVAWCVAYVVSAEGRLVYDAAIWTPVLLVGLVPLGEQYVDRSAAVLAGGLGLAAALLVTATGFGAFPSQVSRYHVLTPDLVAAMRWLAARTPTTPNDVLVADEHGVPLGWWAEGLVGREVLFAADLRWLRFPGERAQAKAANEILYGSDFPGPASLARARAAGLDYVLLPRASAFALKDTPTPWRVALARGDVLVLAAPGGPP